MRMTLILILIDALGTIPKGLVKKLEDKLRPYSIVRVGQKSEKDPVDLKRLTVTQIPAIDHQITLVWKTHLPFKNVRS